MRRGIKREGVRRSGEERGEEKGKRRGDSLIWPKQ